MLSNIFLAENTYGAGFGPEENECEAFTPNL